MKRRTVQTGNESLHHLFGDKLQVSELRQLLYVNFPVQNLNLAERYEFIVQQLYHVS